MKIIVNVNQYGYEILFGDELVYTAGNSMLDSASTVKPGTRFCVPVASLQVAALQTALEIIEERGFDPVDVTLVLNWEGADD